MFSREELLLHICVFVLLVCLCFQADADLNASRQMEKPFSEHLKLNDARSDQVETRSQGAEFGPFRFWCYTAQTAPASPPHGQFSETSCEVKNKKERLFYRSSSLPGPCLLCSSLRLWWGVLAFTWQHTANTQNQMSARLISDQTFWSDW